MSGPKISVYSLTERARAIVVGQMRCEQQSVACHAWTQEIVRSFQPFFGSFDQQLRNLQLLMKRTSEGAGQIEQLQAIRKEATTEAAEIENELAAHTPQVSAKYRITEDALAEKQAELKRFQTLQKRAKALQAKLESALSRDKKNVLRIQAGIFRDLEASDAGNHVEQNPRILQYDDAQSVQRIQASIINDLSGIVSFDVGEEASDTSFQDKKDAIHRNLTELLKDRSLPEYIRSKTRNALVSLQRANDLQHLRTFDAVTVAGIFKMIDVYRQETKKREEEPKELLARYEALCTMAGEEAKQFSLSETAAETIRAEIERLELLFVHQQEQAYISECVDEVMAEMGYNLIGSREVHKKSGKSFRNELFAFNEGTAVNVTYSSDGQISMELGGLAQEDRIPTTDEAELLTHDMESFCGEFADFERRMLIRGIVVGSRVALSPPSAEYAAIINVNDYDVAGSMQISMMDAVGKRRKQAGKKVMRRDE